MSCVFCCLFSSIFNYLKFTLHFPSDFFNCYFSVAFITIKSYCVRRYTCLIKGKNPIHFDIDVVKKVLWTHDKILSEQKERERIGSEIVDFYVWKNEQRQKNQQVKKKWRRNSICSRLWWMWPRHIINRTLVFVCNILKTLTIIYQLWDGIRSRFIKKSRSIALWLINTHNT